MPHHDRSRRQFIGYFSSIGLSSTLLPGVLWSQVQEQQATTVTPEMLKHALAVAGLEFSDEQRDAILNGVNQNLTRYAELRQIHIDPNLAPPLYYSPLVPGTRLDRTPRPFRAGAPRALRRPGHLEDTAFWPIADLAHLIKSRQVTSVELTRMCLDRLHRYNPLLNFVVTFTDDLALHEAQQADREIASGKYRGPLHGLPWGCKDIIAVPASPTQWGSGAYKGQVIDTEATVVRLLRDAGAVLLAKLTTGELAAGDQWFGGRTNNPWDPKDGSSGSSAGPASATAAGCVAFGIGTETSGSILSPSTICGRLGAESGASFDEFSRTGGDKDLTNKGRGNGMRTSRLVPAIEYLQTQRVRAMIMRQFAETVSRFDVYVAPYINMRAGGAGRAGEAGDVGRGGRSGRAGEAGQAEGAGRGRGDAPPPPSAIRDHFTAANLCGYPAVSVRNGFTADGKPTSVTFLGRLYNEAEILSLARAYQDRAGWHLKHPSLTMKT